jgi:hypothetical protein
MSSQRIVSFWLFAATILGAGPSASVPTAGPPPKAREIVTQGTGTASLTTLERAKATAAGIRIPGPGETPVGVQARFTILSETRFSDVRPKQHRTMEERP